MASFFIGSPNNDHTLVVRIGPAITKDGQLYTLFFAIRWLWARTFGFRNSALSLAPMSEATNFHMTPDEFRHWGHAVVDWIANYQNRVEDLPVLSPAQPGQI